MNPKHIIKALPLLASVLGRKYGVQVRIGGDTAFTNGNIIQLPSLPLDGDETLIGLIRGYLDHEAAHIRATDFDTLNTANVTPLEKHIWNMLLQIRPCLFWTGCSSLFVPGTWGNWVQKGIASELRRKSIIPV